MPENSKSYQIGAKVTEKDVMLLDEYCKKNDLNRSYVIRQALREYLDRHMDK